jgi:cytochrome c553
MHVRSLLVVASLWGAGTAAAAGTPPVPCPEGYRHWMHVKSMVISAGHPLYDAIGGIHHLYANNKTERADAGNAATACHPCHTARKDQDFVFSALRR